MMQIIVANYYLLASIIGAIVANHIIGRYRSLALDVSTANGANDWRQLAPTGWLYWHQLGANGVNNTIRSSIGANERSTLSTTFTVFFATKWAVF